jgi:hypothetical protein
MDGYLAGTAWVNGLDRPFLQFRSDSIDIEGLPESQLEAAGTSRDQLRQLLRDWELRTAAVTWRQDGDSPQGDRFPTSGLALVPVVIRWGSRQAHRAGSSTDQRDHLWFDRIFKGKPVPVLDELRVRIR